MNSFEKRVWDTLATIGTEVLSYDEALFEPYQELYRFVWEYAYKKQLYYTAVSLPLVRGIFVGAHQKQIHFLKDSDLYLAYYNHSLSVCRILIDLAVAITPEEEDIVLSAALCHIVPEMISLERYEKELDAFDQIAPQVFEIIDLITRTGSLSQSQQERFYRRIQENKLAVLVRLADRGNLVEQLHGVSLWTAQEYAHETRQYFFPMCIYAQEHYPELSSVVTLLMGKMRYMIEVVDILTMRYQARELALTNEIMTLKEENSRIRRMIAQLESDEEM